MNDIGMLSVSELVAGFRRLALSPVEVMCAVLDQVTRIDPRVNCLCGIDEEGALTAAREAEDRWARRSPCGVLDGVPVSVKDLVAVRGMPTRYGSFTASADAEDFDAPAVAHLRQAGAILFGKTTTSEFGNKIVTDSPLSGVTRNPWDTRRSPGGSSGGSAVAVALGMGPLSLATDGGGSIRIPACWSGVVGFKPSFGLVPEGPASSFAALSTLGPIARCVEDAALMVGVMAGPTDADRFAGVDGGRDYRIGLAESIAGLRIAFSPQPAGVRVDPSIAACVGKATWLLEVLGAHVEEVKVRPLAGYVESRMHSIQWAVLFAQRVRAMNIVQRTQLDPDLRELAAAGERVSTAAFVDALAARHTLAQEMAGFFEEYDLLATPVFHVGPPEVPGLPEALLMAPPLTSWCNQTGQPAASVPCGLTHEGLPVGLQIIGARGADALVLRAARAYEAARGPFPAPPLVRDLAESAKPQGDAS
ncbi:amidase [Caballeronia mineralivorans PML1(12)]|uniref:Amidase n=1 Tax=Caballeronia mineralivorans PML1(12) TaxID=908627 RepID=A0A0J1CIR3_9BURK|nr:amidase family protein [Caballeronia mineralivorans]KLU20560.1 amidase [Caballeronia mineralivorans PML1(12)]